MLPGGTVQETTQLNIESLWSGGPFADPVSVFLPFLLNDPRKSVSDVQWGK